MSGIAVIHNLDGRPVDRGLLSRMIEAAPYRGPDGIHVWTDGPVGLAHAMMCTTVESLRESQPLVDGDAGLVLTLDGRVDNREELSALLTAKGCRPRDDTDAELVLRAYECWGEDSPAKIIGDFAYALWDARRRQLFCARDVLGVKPLYYFCDGTIFLAASELHQLMACSRVSHELNEGQIAEYLSAELRNRDETFYADIRRLPGAHFLAVDSAGVRLNRYYDLRSTADLHYANDGEYAEHFREIFRESVRCCMRSNAPVAATLSGGLDSSSLLGMAASIL
ncbi:MAG TPA: asparagine synthase-related protein, partial [Candidatus Acidoferrales bacterium]|nr:asparagine synthase-related protein [Candidatus Acidoferrales bacterium]